MTITARISPMQNAEGAPWSVPPSRRGQRSAPECLSDLGDVNDLARCLWPLLETLGWSGDARHLVEALPHFANGLDLDAFRAVMARLGYTSVLMPRQSCDRIDPRLLPALVLTDDRRGLVICAPDAEGRTLVRNPARDTEGPDDLRRLRGLVCIFRRIEGSDAGRQAAEAGNWVSFLLAGFRATYLRSLGLSALVALVAVTPVLFVMALIDLTAPREPSELLIAMIAGAFGALGIEAILRHQRSRALASMGERLRLQAAHELFRQLLYMPLGSSGAMPVGSTVRQLRASDRIRDIFAGDAVIALLELPFSLVFVLALAIIAGGIALIPLTAMMAFALSAWLLSRDGAGRTANARFAASARQDFLFEAVPLADHVRLTGATASWRARFRDLSGRSAHAGFRVSTQNALVGLFGQLVLVAAVIITLGLGVLRLHDGALTEGGLFAAAALTWLALRPWHAALPHLLHIRDMRAEIADINVVMQVPQEQDALSSSKDVAPVQSGQIRFSRVSLSHARGLEPAVAGLELDIVPGEIVAITGPNGAGKSTLLHLILGLHAPQSGEVMIADTDIRQQAQIALRQSIGHVPQKFDLFYGTIRQNLLLSMPTASQGDIEAAARRAGVHDAIMRWPDGYDHRVGDERSALVPTTLRNGLALAAAYLRMPRILLLDEAVDNLDEEMTDALLAEIARLRGNVTTLIVTHRPSTMRCADRLIVMNGGRIVDSGKPDGLLK